MHQQKASSNGYKLAGLVTSSISILVSIILAYTVSVRIAHEKAVHVAEELAAIKQQVHSMEKHVDRSEAVLERLIHGLARIEGLIEELQRRSR